VGAKAVAGTSSTGVSGALVAVALWALGFTPPQEIVIALTTLVSAPLTYVAVYFTPHTPGAP
jgi:multisubunit Na+/H+ antiporter MnhG subunit